MVVWAQRHEPDLVFPVPICLAIGLDVLPDADRAIAQGARLEVPGGPQIPGPHILTRQKRFHDGGLFLRRLKPHQEREQGMVQGDFLSG